MERSRLLPILAVVFVDLLGFGLVLPLLPFFAETFGANPVEIGLLITTYAAAQMVGAPILGRLSDRHGRKRLLLVSIAGTALGFALLGFAQSLPMIFASRALAGLFGGNIAVAQAYIADVTDERNRARGMGLIGATFGLGFVFGPVIGGALSANGFALPAFVAAGMASLNLIAVAFLLPESLTAERRAELARRPRGAFTIRALGQALTRPRVGPLLQVRFFFGLAFAAFIGIFPLYAEYRLGLGAQGTSFVFAYFGVLMVFTQAIAVGWLTARVSDDNLILGAVATMSAALLAWALILDVSILLVSLIPLSLAGGVFNTVVNSALSKAVARQEVGGTLGLAAGVESLTRVLGPVIGGLLFQAYGTGAPGLFGAAFLAAILPFAWHYLPLRSGPPRDGDDEQRGRPITVEVRNGRR